MIKAVQKQDGDPRKSKQSGNKNMYACNHVGSSESCWAHECWKDERKEPSLSVRRPSQTLELKQVLDVHLTNKAERVKEAQSFVETTAELEREAAERCGCI